VVCLLWELRRVGIRVHRQPTIMDEPIDNRSFEERIRSKWTTVVEEFTADITMRIMEAIDEWDGYSSDREKIQFEVDCGDIWQCNSIAYANGLKILRKNNDDINDIIDKSAKGIITISVSQEDEKKSGGMEVHIENVKEVTWEEFDEIAYRKANETGGGWEKGHDDGGFLMPNQLYEKQKKFMKTHTMTAWLKWLYVGESSICKSIQHAAKLTDELKRQFGPVT
jgi:hypothetical protein